MPLTELAIRTAAACIGVSLVLFLYTHALLLIGRCLAGATKVAVSLVVYLFVAGAIGTGLLFVLGSASDLEVRQSWKYVTTVLAAWALILTPGILYVRKHLRRLQSMGFFRSR